MNLTTRDQLRQMYGAASERATLKEMRSLDRHAQQFIALSPFVVLASSNVSGQMDASPRGGDPGFVKVIDNQTLLIPDAPGNNRLDTLENIIDTGQLGLLFMLPGFDETLRINGQASLSTDPSERQLCTDARRTPALVIRVRVQAVYLHCAKAFMRSQLWNPSKHTPRHLMPSMGEMLRDQIQTTQGHAIEAETQEDMMARYRQSL
jgi:PPOX class probable FMN-dependent enzyme